MKSGEMEEALLNCMFQVGPTRHYPDLVWVRKENPNFSFVGWVSEIWSSLMND